MTSIELLAETDRKIITCHKCTISYHLKLYPMPGFYTDPSKVKLFVVGINPGQPQPNEDILLKELNNDYKKHYERGIKNCKVGFFLDKVLNELKIGWDEIFFTNIIKCSTPENRMPTEIEINECSEYLRDQRNAVLPKKVLLLGKFVAQAIGIEDKVPFAREYNKVKYYCVHHPSYLARTNSTDKAVKFIKEKYGNIH